MATPRRKTQAIRPATPPRRRTAQTERRLRRNHDAKNTETAP